MSHFTVGVILPDYVHDNDTIESALAELMAPFDENMEVAPYQRECYCVGMVAYRAADAYVNKIFGNWNDIRDNEELRREYNETKDNYRMHHELDGKPDPNCNECHGTGWRESTYNLKRKWDWYVIGGRWKATLPNDSNYIRCKNILTADVSQRPTEPEHDDFYDFFIEDYKRDLYQYISTPEDIRDLYSPFAILTPDGVWHERGEMHWFAMVDQEKERHAWLREVKSVYEQYADNLMVLVDAHI